MVETHFNLDLIAERIEELKKKYQTNLQNIIYPPIYYQNLRVLGKLGEEDHKYK